MLALLSSARRMISRTVQPGERIDLPDDHAGGDDVLSTYPGELPNPREGEEARLFRGLLSPQEIPIVKPRGSVSSTRVKLIMSSFHPPHAFDPEQLDLVEQTYEAVCAELAPCDPVKGEERKKALRRLMFAAIRSGNLNPGELRGRVLRGMARLGWGVVGVSWVRQAHTHRARPWACSSS
jgi:hypothetical protein